VLAAGALALLALDVGLELQPAPVAQPSVVAAPVATTSEPSSVHNLAYYPEQLAALNSLASFTPQADAGVAEPAAPALKPPAPVGAIKPPARRADLAVKPAATVRAPAATQPPDRSVKLFGIPVPGAAEVFERVASLRESASHWGEAARDPVGKAAPPGR